MKRQHLQSEDAVLSENYDLEQNSQMENVKKKRFFSAKEFRRQLNKADPQTVVTDLTTFLHLIQQNTNHDHLLEYLEQGGNCLELLQILETNSNVSPVLIFELVTYVLLKITENGHKYQKSAYNSCKYILNNYIVNLNKMISMSSTTPERKTCLKLLTAIVAFSSNLAKDVLINISIHSTNLELLTKHTGDSDSVREHFIHFLTAFLIDGHYPALSILLEKKGFITSIVKGLQFDFADTLCLVVTSMKNHILENPLVSKTTKMKTFNTIVIRDIVNLYNWKGPEAFKAQKKNSGTLITVDQIEKSKVNESVHDFLLTLCTSQKYGVVFKDSLVGLGKKNQNALLYTVLESLDRPWDHSYASDLVIKICGACPDLSKTVWNNLKPYLEPRWTEKWLNAMNFAKNLIRELKPNCIDYCIKDTNVGQLFQIVQILVAPLPILKVLIPEDKIFESISLKHHILLLILEMLTSLKTYLYATESWLSTENSNKFKSYIVNYVSKNFPSSLLILKGWENLIDDTDRHVTIYESIETIVDIFENYKDISPVLLEDLNSDEVNFTHILKKLQEVEDPQLSKIQIRCISIFIHLDFSKFKPKTENFTYVVKLLMRFYYEHNDCLAKDVLKALFKNTGIFHGCLYEIGIWIGGILDLKRFEEAVVDDIIRIVELTYENLQEFLEEMSSVSYYQGKTLVYTNILEHLEKMDVALSSSNAAIRHRYLSPMCLGLAKHLSETEFTKSLKIYTNFVMLNLAHAQTEITDVINLLNKFDVKLHDFKSYILSWQNCEEICTIKKSKGRLGVLHHFSEHFLEGDVANFLENFAANTGEELLLNLVDCGVFYITNLLKNDQLTPKIVDQFSKFHNYILTNNLSTDEIEERVFANPIFLEKVNFLNCTKDNSQGFVTTLLVNLINDSHKAEKKFDRYLKFYKEKLVANVLKFIKKPNKYDAKSFQNILEVFNLDYIECQTVLKALGKLFDTSTEVSDVSEILIHVLKELIGVCQGNSNLEPLPSDVVLNISRYHTNLCKNNQACVNTLSAAFYEYLKLYPHIAEYVDEELMDSLLLLNEYSKDNVSLIIFLLSKNSRYVANIQEHLDTVCSKKGVILPIITALTTMKGIDNDFLKSIYEKIEGNLLKAVEKPQKAGQHFHANYEGLPELITKFMPVEMCEKFAAKVQKYEVSEIFHVKLLAAIFGKISNSNRLNSKTANNIILTFVHLQINLLKKGSGTEEVLIKINEITSSFDAMLRELHKISSEVDLSSTCNNESVKLYFKFCLKYGVSGNPALLKSLRNLMTVLIDKFDKQEGKLILEMLVSHSEFLVHVLGQHSEIKFEIWSVFFTLCERWDDFMEREHVPVLLASYKAMVNKCDRLILRILRKYEKHANQTHIYDFKPFLWGKAAATHYSVKVKMETVLLRQPKTGDVLDILQDDLVRATIVNYPLDVSLSGIEELEDERKCYDLSFMLPTFSQLLAPEQQIATYKFTRAGALSLAVVALSSHKKDTRQAACHVLQRFYSQVEARQTGKDNLLWLRYVEAVCRGTASIPNWKLNNFAAIYLARMALILTQPNHDMYLPLSKHLLAKSSLDFSTVPELYTFLHSPDMNYKEHRNFILKLLKDGLRTDRDFTDFMKSMAFKLISELYSSSLSDAETKLLILDVIKTACKLPMGFKVLRDNHSLLVQFGSEFDKEYTGKNRIYSYLIGD